ncbi:hypothetical protein [Dyella caseinilytica]|uniref:Uncharacterized protein n=1 Tax=Dyella caseinilytica TaxID=1849581 RepID=A0ABX7GWN7_9GAMM|nr:hypothetical protein [Dyella caseinilytica]QRN53615.1 hypothetical protein ISN74_19790 [Dyella caseinilytica]GFZ87914.1 hypothetical protein GCM10011408_03200 [Dyella caseinilytica]
MMQRQVTHAAGSFAACATCNKEPHHYTAHGSTRHEDPVFSAMRERHQLECVCERRTGWCSTLAEAVRLWEELGETLPPVTSIETGGNVHPIRTHRTADTVSHTLERRPDEAQTSHAEHGDGYGADVMLDG